MPTAYTTASAIAAPAPAHNSPRTAPDKLASLMSASLRLVELVRQKLEVEIGLDRGSAARDATRILDGALELRCIPDGQRAPCPQVGRIRRRLPLLLDHHLVDLEAAGQRAEFLAGDPAPGDVPAVPVLPAGLAAQPH